MTPKEKAEDLADKYFDILEDYMEGDCWDKVKTSIHCALLSIEEILNSRTFAHEIMKQDPNFDPTDFEDFWLEVKKELLKM